VWGLLKSFVCNTDLDPILAFEWSKKDPRGFPSPEVRWMRLRSDCVPNIEGLKSGTCCTAYFAGIADHFQVRNLSFPSRRGAPQESEPARLPIPLSQLTQNRVANRKLRQKPCRFRRRFRSASGKPPFMSSDRSWNSPFVVNDYCCDTAVWQTLGPALPGPKGLFAVGRMGFDWTVRSCREVLSKDAIAKRELMASSSKNRL
jgi:hypothetical protein